MSRKTSSITFSNFLSPLLLGMLFSTSSMAARTIPCPDGEHIEIDIQQITIQYQGTTFGATLNGLSVLGARLKVEPKTLQVAAAATQQWNEFVKGLVVGYNSCAITKQQYQEGLMRIYPRLEKDGIELENLRKLVLNKKQIDEKHLQKVLISYESRLRAFAKISRKDVDYQRIEAIVTKHLKLVSA